MTNAAEQISEQLFKIIKGARHQVVLYTDEGKETIDPTEARRFYIKDLQTMINFINDENTSELVVNLSKGVDIDSIKPLLDAIRTLANRYIVEYTVKTFGKAIDPKDFSYQAKAMGESKAMERNVTEDRNTVHLKTGGKNYTVDLSKGRVYRKWIDNNNRPQSMMMAPRDPRVQKIIMLAKSKLQGNTMNEEASTERSYVGDRIAKTLKKAGVPYKVNKSVKGDAFYLENGNVIHSDGVGISVVVNGEEQEYFGKPKMNYHRAVDAALDATMHEAEQLDELTPKQKAMKQGYLASPAAGPGRGQAGGRMTSQNLKRNGPAYPDHERAEKLIKNGPRGTAAAFDKGSKMAHDQKTTQDDDRMYTKAVNDRDVWDLESRIGSREYKKQHGKDWTGRDLEDGSTWKYREHPVWTRRRNRLKGPVNKLPEGVNEGFSGWSGSARKSINELGDARLIVRHKRNVDEDKRGARTRQIESIFIENSEGERFKFPNKNITAAKAMVKHVKEGGAPHDSFGQHIYSVMEELQELKKFQRHNRRNNFFESEQEISEEIAGRVEGLRSTLKQIAGPKGYAKHFESFNKESDNCEVDDEQLNELQDAVTVRYFDESIASSLPYVAKVIEGLRGRQAKDSDIADFARYVIKNQDQITLNRELDLDDPECPDARDYSDRATEVAAWVDYLAPYVSNDELSNMMMKMSDDVYNASSKHINMAMQAIKVIKQNASVAEQAHMEKINAEDEQLSKINETFDKYTVHKIFGAKK